jgi:hypothetical protein
MWFKIIFSSILVYKFNEYLKIVEIALVHVLGLVEDEKIFNHLFFMKTKLCNQQSHILNCVFACSHIFIFVLFLSLFGNFFSQS